MKSNNEQHLVYSKQVIEFITIANEYCSFVEGVSELSLQNFVTISHKLLSLLYYKTLTLPQLENEYNEGNEKFVTEQDWNLIKEKVSQKLKQYDSFLNIQTTITKAVDELESTTVSECFADIYQDLKDCTTLYQIGTAEIMNDGVWECRQNFEQFWGPRLISLLQVMHDLLFSGEPLNENVENTDKKEASYDEIDTASWFLTKKIEQQKNQL